MIRSRLRFAEHVLSSPSPVRRWVDFWDYADSRRAAEGKPPVPRPTGHNPTVVAYARVDDGRWIADCPWGCGAAFNLPEGAPTLWCTECAGGGWGNTAALIWPRATERLSINLESWPAMLQFWPCAACLPGYRDGKDVCDTCRGLQGKAI